VENAPVRKPIGTLMHFSEGKCAAGEMMSAPLPSKLMNPQVSSQ
jgi:hypothetical protein